MKSVFLIGAALLMAAGPAEAQRRGSAPAAQLPVFEFKGVTAGQPVDRSLLTSCKSGEAGLHCYFRDSTVAGVKHLLAPAVYLNNEKLSMMIFLFEREHHLTLMSALTQRYGKPCKSEQKQWRNGAGAVLPNPTHTWCFATGELVLTGISSRLRNSDLVYTDTANRAPARSAPVDF
jgi:hypothetical protein